MKDSEIYRALVALRVVFAFLGTGYIHPDEYFQNGEVTAGSTFGVYAPRTWEWDPLFPCRSILPPFLTTGLPFFLWKYVSQGSTAPWAMFVIQRASFLLLSFILDFVVARLVPHRRTTALVLLGSSYVMLTFQLRPFSNSIEALLVALSLLILQDLLKESPQRSNLTKLSLLVVVCVVGVFTRITFLAFALPIIIQAVLSILKPSPDDGLFFPAWLQHISQAVLLGILITLAFVSFDSFFFTGSLSRPVLTPLNFLLYNLAPANLAEHGLHPRWLHVVVNLPMIVGPSLLYAGVRAAWAILRADKSAKDKREESPSSIITSTCLYIICGSLLILSIQPHQEPRFLTPLVVPFVILVANSGYIHRAGKVFWVTLVVVNVALSFLFGILHQGGVVPSLAHVHGLISTNNATSSVVVYWKTYMPPRHLLAIPDKDVQAGKVTVVDLQGASVDNVQKHLHGYSTRHEDTPFYLVAPPYAVQSLDPRLAMCFDLDKRVFPHLDLDHIPESVEMGLEGGLSLDVRVARLGCILQSSKSTAT